MNNAPLHAELSSLRELVVSLQAALERSRQENLLLRQKIDLLVRRVFGSSSERLDRAQLELLLQLPVLVDPAPAVAKLPGNEGSVSAIPGAVFAGKPEPLGRCPVDDRSQRPGFGVWRLYGHHLTERHL